MAEFSESAYSHAVFSELRQKYEITDFEIPSTRAEGSQNLGYDLKALVQSQWYFLQFKVPSQIRPSKAAAIGTNLPYYFEIRHKQHADLLAIGSSNVYYVAPNFYQRSELATHFRNLAIDEHSMSIELTNGKFAGKDITKRHYVTFDARTFEVHSEQDIGVPYKTLDQILARDGMRAEDGESARDFLDRLLEMLTPDKEARLTHKKAVERSDDDEIPYILVGLIATRLAQLGLHAAVRPRELPDVQSVIDNAQ